MFHKNLQCILTTSSQQYSTGRNIFKRTVYFMSIKNSYLLPGVGVAIAIAFVPVGVTPLGVIIEGVACGVPCGVP
jgi:hypothetical protein